MESSASFWAFSTCGASLTIYLAALLGWISLTECLEGVRPDCLRAASAPGVIDPSDRLARCASDLYVKPCAARTRRFDDCSAKPGEARGGLPDGATCFDHAQCAGGSCAGSMVPIAGACGRCARTPIVGDACADDGACMTNGWFLPDTGLLCEAGRCVRGAFVGESCAARRCLASTICVDGTCQRPVGTAPAGAPCKYPFECRAGSRCSDLDGVCREIRIVAEGETCHRRGDVTSDRTLLCGAGLYCTAKSVCVPYVAPGERCEARDGELACGWTASCKTTSNEDLRVCIAIGELCR